MWAARYDGPTGGDDWAHSLGLSPDGARVFVTGDSGSGSATIAYDADTGQQLWLARSGGLFSGSLGVAGNGTRVVITGTGGSKKTRSDYATIAYDAASGHEVWLRRYNGPGVVCLVPAVVRLTLRAAERQIRAADCTIGRIIRNPSANAPKGRIADQRPWPGTRLRPKGRVTLWLKP